MTLGKESRKIQDSCNSSLALCKTSVKFTYSLPSFLLMLCDKTDLFALLGFEDSLNRSDPHTTQAFKNLPPKDHQSQS